jgi:hypothetical protein
MFARAVGATSSSRCCRRGTLPRLPQMLELSRPSTNMKTHETPDKLDQVMQAARTTLSSNEQDELAELMLARVAYLAQSQLTPPQRAEIKRRISNPAYASDKEVEAVFVKYRKAA